MTLAVIKELKKTFLGGTVVALDGITVQIPEGIITGVVGPDGAGKTTLLRTLTGLMSIDSGTGSVFAYDIATQAEKIQQNLGYLPQKFGLYEDLTVAQNLALFSNLQGISQNDPQLQKLMQFSGLFPFQQRLVGDLSGGMKQKLGIVVTMMRTPKLILLDEPTTGVDPLSQEDLWKMILELHQQNITIVVTTSDLSEADRCQHIILLNEGKVLFAGDPKDFKKTVEGKTFFFDHVGSKKRQAIDLLLGNHGIIDAMVAGEKVRVTFDKSDPITDPQVYGFDKKTEIYPREPDIEDAFIYRLGGVPKRPTFKISQESLTDKDDENAIEAIGLTKYFGNFIAVNKISFAIKRGEIFGLLGPNGAGKSTTFKMLCGLIKPTEGEAFVGGVSLKKSTRKAREMMGYMAQKFSLYDNMTVMQNMRFFSGIYPVKNRDNAIAEMVEVFHLQDYVNTLTRNLPLGFKQRLALSCALMHRPKVLFLDEPTSGIDPLTRREFWHQINVLAAAGVSVLISTHLMDEAEFCDRIGLIYQGMLRVTDTPEKLKERLPSSKDHKVTLTDVFKYFCAKDTMDK